MRQNKTGITQQNPKFLTRITFLIIQYPNLAKKFRYSFSVIQMPISRGICQEQPSKFIVKKCKNMIGRFSTSCGWNRKNVVVLFNKTIKLYIKSCEVEGYNPNAMACKVLYLADQLCLKFGGWLLEVYPQVSNHWPRLIKEKEESFNPLTPSDLYMGHLLNKRRNE